MTFDIKSASIQGKVRHARVRVLWREGTMRVFGVVGLLLELKTTKPTRMKGYLHSWMVDSEAGTLVIKGKCMTCGGPKWWRVMRIPADNLWSSA